MKKFLYIIWGFAAGLLMTLVIIPYVQSAMYFSSLHLLDDANTFRNYWLIFCAVFPLLISIVFIEITLFVLARKLKNNLNLFLILFQIVLMGYLIYSVFSVFFSIIFNTSSGNLLAVIIQGSSYSHNAQLAIVLACSIFLLGYLNLILKRMKSALPAVIKNKPGKLHDIKK